MRIDNTQQNSKRRLSGEKDVTINYIIKGCSKLVHKEYKTINVWLGKIIHWDFCKILKFDHNTKWNNYKPESVLEKETHKKYFGF